jgi:hypothetical protein
MRLSTQHINGAWWILGLPCSTPDDTDRCGPYDTKAEAVDDRRGLERFYRDNPVKADHKCRPKPPPQSPSCSCTALSLRFFL